MRSAGRYDEGAKEESRHVDFPLSSDDRRESVKRFRETEADRTDMGQGKAEGVSPTVRAVDV